LLLSDDLSALTPERLQIAVKLLPLLGKRAEVLDWFERITPQYLKLVLENDTGRWHLLARFNWEDQPANVTMTAAGYRLPDADYWVSSFWDNKICYCLKGQPLASQIVPAHGVLLLAVRPVLEGTPQILGSDLHISQGLEVKNWQVEPGAFDCTFDLGRQAAGEVELYLPYAPQSAWLDGKPLQWIESGEDRYRFAVAIHDVANLRVSWRVP
jgi:alpha-galactosidase